MLARDEALCLLCMGELWLSNFPLKIKTYNFLQGVGWRGGQRTCEGDGRTGNESRGRKENAIHTQTQAQVVHRQRDGVKEQ